MKKLSVIMTMLSVLTACSKRGETSTPKDFIIIHGKTYKLISVTPCDGCSYIWIMYPKDSLDNQPEVVNWEERSGKTTIKRTLIKVD